MTKHGWRKAAGNALGLALFLGAGVGYFLYFMHLAAVPQYPIGFYLFGLLMISNWAGTTILLDRSGKDWLWTVVPFAIFIALHGRAEWAAKAAATDQAITAMRDYMLRSFEFIGFLLAWLVVSPSGLVTIPPARARFSSLWPRGVLPWRLILLLLAAAILAFSSLRAWGYLADSSLAGPQRYYRIQTLYIGIGCLIYVLAVVRIRLLTRAARHSGSMMGDIGVAPR